MARFSYIHISDTHLCSQPTRANAISLMKRQVRQMIDTGWSQGKSIGFLSLARPASYLPHIVSGVAQFCYDYGPMTDGIIFTGDVATTGLMADIGVARSFVSEPSNVGFVSTNGAPTLNVQGARIYVLPGNHDKFADNSGTPNGRNFELAFDGYMPNYARGVGHWVEEKNGAYLGFIYADFSLQSRFDALDKIVGVYGQGRVYNEIFGQLKDRTLNLREKFRGIPIVWILHFAPFECGYELRLLDRELIIECAVKLNVVATLCGHTHLTSRASIEKHVVYCAGSAGCVDSGHCSRVQIVHFDVQANNCQASREVFAWNSAEHEFTAHAVD